MSTTNKNKTTTKTTTKRTNNKKKKKITAKKIDPKVIAKTEEMAQYTRAHQARYDDKFNFITMKFNFWPCNACGIDIHINNTVFFTDPQTGRKFLTMHKVCSTSCQKREVVYELHEISADELQKDDINTFTIHS